MDWWCNSVPWRVIVMNCAAAAGQPIAAPHPYCAQGIRGGVRED